MHILPVVWSLAQPKRRKRRKREQRLRNEKQTLPLVKLELIELYIIITYPNLQYNCTEEEIV